MSLRARLLAGMLVVSFVLAASAVIISRTTENDLVHRVDQQLEPVTAKFTRPFPLTGPGGGASAPNRVYGAHVADGSQTVVFNPDVTADRGRMPAVSIGTATDAARVGHPITVGARDGSGRYRLLAIRAPD